MDKKTKKYKSWGLELRSPKGADAQESHSDKEEKKKEKNDFSLVLNLPGTWNCKLCYIERALSITDQVRGFILWKISKERTRVWFHCTTRHCAMPKGKRKNRSTDVSNTSNNSSVGNTTLNTSKKPRVNAESSKQSTVGICRASSSGEWGDREQDVYCKQRQ